MVDDNFFDIVTLCDYDEYIKYAKNAGNAENDKIDEQMPVGHGGRGETQLIMALYESEGLVRMENLDSTDRHIPDWLGDVHKASKENGEFWVDLCAESWAKLINRL